MIVWGVLGGCQGVDMLLSGVFWVVDRVLICDCLGCSGWLSGCCNVVDWGVLGGC